MTTPAQSPRQTEAGHPIQVAARRAGLSPELLRAWERRYGLVAPQRAANGRRLYSEADVEHLRLVRLATEAGRRVSDLAVLPVLELEGLVAADALAAESSSRSGAAPLLARCLEAVEAMDDQALSALLRRAAIELSLADFVEALVVPMMREIGLAWTREELDPAHEHLATAVVTTVLLELTDSLQSGATGPRVVVAAPAGQRHEIGCMVVALAALLEGCRLTYLGADLPAADVARAAKKVQAAAVVLSLTIVRSDGPSAGSFEEIRKLRDELPGDVPILVGGQASGSIVSRIARAGAVPVSDIGTLRQRLRALRHP